MLDQTLLGEVTSPEELQEYLEEYDRDWYIGLESDDQWKSAILSNKPNLFSLGHNNQQVDMLMVLEWIFQSHMSMC